MPDIETEIPRVNVINPEGDLKSLPADQAKIALGNPNSQYRPASADDVENYKNDQEFGGGAQQAIAGVEGVAQGVMGPLAPAAEVGLGLTTGKRILAREKANPGTHYLTQGVGLAGSSLIPGFGEYRDAQAAADVARAAVEAGTMTEVAAKPILDVAEKSINPLSSQSILSGGAARAASAVGLKGGNGIASEAAKNAFKAAFEAGTLQSGDEISHLIMQDPDQSLQSAALDIGAAATIAAPLGGALGAAHPLWKATAGKTLGEVAEDFKGRMKFNLDNPDPVNAMKEELTNHLNASDSVFDEVYGAKGLKADAIGKLMPQQTSDLMVDQAESTAQAGRHFLDEMRKNPDLYPSNLRARYERDFNILSESLGDLQNPQQIFDSLQEFKQRLQSYQPKKGTFITSVDPSHDFLNGTGSLAKELRVGLEDTEVWGKAGSVQQELNKAYSEYLTPRKQMEGKFMSKLGDEKVFDDGKIQTYLNQTGKAGQKLKQDMLGNFLKADQKYRGAVDSVFSKMGQESPFPPSTLQFTKHTLEKQTSGAKLADYVYNKGLSEVAGETMGAGLGAAAGSAFGHPVFGAYLGERTLGHFFKTILPTLAKPLYNGSSSGEGLKAAIDYGSAVIRGQKLIQSSAKNLFKAGVVVLPTAMVPGAKETSKLDSAVQKAQTNPQQFIQGASALGNYYPDHAASHGAFASNVIQHLSTLRPATKQAAPLDKPSEINDIQKSAYERSLQIVQQPLTILNHIKNGSLQVQDIVDLKSTYPKVYDRLAQEISSQMIEHLSDDKTIPYNMRMGLSLFLGQPLDSTMTPMGIQLHQRANQQSQVQAAQEAPQAKKVSTSAGKGLEKISSMTATRSQSLESGFSR